MALLREAKMLILACSRRVWTTQYMSSNDLTNVGRQLVALSGIVRHS